MGSGKTTFGKELGRIINFSFVDTDELIEQELKKSITQIFTGEGESFFRKAEINLIKDLIHINADQVIATGGGMPAIPGLITLLNLNGITVYLKPSLKTIYKRLTSDKENRPLLKGMTNKEIYSFIRQINRDRGDFYKQAKITINPEKVSPDKLAEILFTF